MDRVKYVFVMELHFLSSVFCLRLNLVAKVCIRCSRLPDSRKNYREREPLLEKHKRPRPKSFGFKQGRAVTIAPLEEAAVTSIPTRHPSKFKPFPKKRDDETIHSKMKTFHLSQMVKKELKSTHEGVRVFKFAFFSVPKIHC